MHLQWFPGHMTRAMRMMEEQVKLVDGIVYVLDSRAPYASINNKLLGLFGNKPVLYVLNKSDLVNYSELNLVIKDFEKQVGVAKESEIFKAYKLKDILTVQLITLSSMLDFARTVGKTRGSALYTDENGQLREGLNEQFRFSLENGDTFAKVQEIALCGTECVTTWRDVRKMPNEQDFFENVWRQYRENKNVF